MTIEEIKNLTAEAVEERVGQIKVELESAEGPALEELSKELDALEERKSAIKAEVEARAKIESSVINSSTVVRSLEGLEGGKEMPKAITRDSQEYRDAFYAFLVGDVTEEQRSVLATPLSVDGDAANDGTAVAIPTSLDSQIWDNIHEAHPILADINTQQTGVILKVTKHTAITAGKAQKKKDGADTDVPEENTFVEVNLVGKDYSKYVELTYAQAKMSQGALENYLATEIAEDLGEALAKDVFAQILTDASANAVASTSDYFADLNAALGKAVGATNAVIYANPADYYAIVGAVDVNGQPIFRDGVALGAQIKKDAAATKITVVDPKKFILNVVQGTLIESDRDIKKHRIVISGYLRAEGTLRDNRAAAFIQ